MTRLAIAWTMWEFAPAPKDVQIVNQETGQIRLAKAKSGLVPHCKNRGSLKRRLSYFDMVLCYDHITQASLAPYIPKETRQAVLQGGYEAAEWQYHERDWHTKTDFMFGMHGALNNRKAVWTAVEAWQKVCYEHPDFVRGAKLGLHTTVQGVFPELTDILKHHRVKVFMEAWDHETLQGFYNNVHCMLFPSRGEGKNLPALEHMTTGGVCAATNYSGHTMWMHDSYAYPLEYQLTPTFAQRPDAAHDAKVSPATLADMIWHIYTHRAEAREKAELAAQVIPKMCSWDVVVSRLFDVIRDSGAHNSELLWAMAQFDRQQAEEKRRSRSLTASLSR